MLRRPVNAFTTPLAASASQHGMLAMSEKDPVVEALKRYKVPVTRSNWIKFSYPDGPPKPWTAEHEAELPEELQLKSREDGGIFNEM